MTMAIAHNLQGFSAALRCTHVGKGKAAVYLVHMSMTTAHSLRGLYTAVRCVHVGTKAAASLDT